MFRFKCRLQLPEFNLTAYRRDLANMLLEELSHAAFQWLDAVLAEIPTWSGASRATFLQLSREISYPLFINQSPNAPDRTALGERLSGGDLDTSKLNKGIASFTYNTRLEHLIYNEFNNANITPDPTLFSRLLKPGPYGFQRKGQEAFERSVADMNLPDPTKYITTRRRKVGR